MNPSTTLCSQASCSPKRVFCIRRWSLSLAIEMNPKKPGYCGGTNPERDWAGVALPARKNDGQNTIFRGFPLSWADLHLKQVIFSSLNLWCLQSGDDNSRGQIAAIGLLSWNSVGGSHVLLRQFAGGITAGKHCQPLPPAWLHSSCLLWEHLGNQDRNSLEKVVSSLVLWSNTSRKCAMKWWHLGKIFCKLYFPKLVVCLVLPPYHLRRNSPQIYGTASLPFMFWLPYQHELCKYTDNMTYNLTCNQPSLNLVISLGQLNTPNYYKIHQDLYNDLYNSCVDINWLSSFTPRARLLQSFPSQSPLWDVHLRMPRHWRSSMDWYWFHMVPFWV